MKFSKLLLTLVAVILSVTTQAYNPGLTAHVSSKIVIKYKKQLTQFILKMLQTVVIPDIVLPDDHGVIGSNVWSLTKITADQVNITFSEEDNAVGVIINDVMAKFHSSNFQLKEGIIHATGELDAALYRVQFIAAT